MSLYNKYRPKQLSEIIGQDAVVESLEGITARKDTQSFLFTGPAGTGKTTLARIVARKLGCKLKDRLDIDGATFNGVDDMRKLQEVVRYRPFGDGEKRAVIGDEIHRLSGNAWDALLKATEEPPPHVVWLFCTTNPDKIPKTIKTRCVTLTLKPIPDDDLYNLVNNIAKIENMSIPEQILGLIVREAYGSARQAISNLEVCRDTKDRARAAELLKTAVESENTIEFCRFIIKGGSWKKAMSLMTKLEGENPEGIRILTCNYLAVALKNSNTEQDATHLLTLLENFSTPFNQAEGNAPLYLAIGRCLYSGE
jgi:DNA polymerase III gamma/tau subunit